MNREIIFRGKSLNTGQWLYGDLRHDNVRRRTYIEYEVDPKTVGQYTGLNDKNGKKIYEGDILRFTVPDGTTRHFTIEWADEDRILKSLSFVHDGNPVRISGWCFNWNGNHLYPTVVEGVPDNEVMEVVGNIYDNPELFEGEE